MSVMADDPDIRETGRVEDDQGRVVIVGINHGAVTLRTLHTRTDGAVELSSYRAEEFAQAFVSACWQAGWHQGRDGVQDGGT